MSNSATHFCGWCNIPRSRISMTGSPRSYDSILRDYKEWIAESGDRKDAANFNNCISEPILHPDCNTPIVELIPPPELHLLLGITTHIFDELKKELPEVAENWLKQANIEKFHGGSSFNGNGARRLLKCCDILENLSPGLNFRKL